MYNPNSIKWQKTSYWAWFRPVGFKFRPPNCFFKNLASLFTWYHSQLSLCTISEENNYPILRKISDGWTNRQIDESDSIGCCPTNVEHPKLEAILNKGFHLRCNAYKSYIYVLNKGSSNLPVQIMQSIVVSRIKEFLLLLKEISPKSKTLVNFVSLFCKIDMPVFFVRFRRVHRSIFYLDYFLLFHYPWNYENMGKFTIYYLKSKYKIEKTMGVD